MKPQHSAATAAATYQPRRATRSTGDRLLGGVCAGLADHLGVDVMLVRGAFVVASALGGLGVAVYAGLWMILPTDARFAAAAPGLEAASRQGRRPTTASRLEDVGPLVALAAVALGVVVLVQSVVGSTVLFWPLLLGLLGLAVLWRQADEAQRERWADATGRIDPLRAVVGRGEWRRGPGSPRGSGCCCRRSCCSPRRAARPASPARCWSPGRSAWPASP